MKSLFVLCIILVAGIHASYIPLPPHYTDSRLEECRKETGFSDEALKKMKDNPYTEDGGEVFKEFTKCYLEKTGFITSDGKLNIDEAISKLGLSFAKQIFEHCKTHVRKESCAKEDKFVVVPTETVEDYSECFRQGVQNYIWFSEKDGFEPFTHVWQD